MRRSFAVALALWTLMGCSTPPEGLLDRCNGGDDDGDGLVDEDTGEAAGCEATEICVAARCVPNCGDAYCDPRESCGVCPTDCGACPFCGDGECNGGEVCGDCPVDCGDCPFCGDGTCNGSDSCASCREDCGLCPGECAPCGPGFSCGAGLECLLRRCDGAAGCYLLGATVDCPTIGGQVCPPVRAWDHCMVDADCGRLRCISGRCVQGPEMFPEGTDPCWTDAFWCPPEPSTPAGLDVECSTGCVAGRGCYSRCTMTCTSSCPYGLTCSGGYCVDL
jgi:hypothetical protein